VLGRRCTHKELKDLKKKKKKRTDRERVLNEMSS
jgi:hypothetical protein